MAMKLVSNCEKESWEGCWQSPRNGVNKMKRATCMDRYGELNMLFEKARSRTRNSED
jgi:hypothetical protein